MDGAVVNQVIDDLKRLEHEGYHFEAADASLELLMRRAAGWEHDFFRVESMRVITDELSSSDVHHRGDGQGLGRRRALRVHVGGQRPGQRDRHRAAGGDPAGLPAPRQHPPHRLQGADPRRRRGHRRRDAGAAVGDRRRDTTGRRSASAPTSSRRRGGRSRRASSTGCSTPTARTQSDRVTAVYDRRRHVCPQVSPRRTARDRPTTRRPTSCPRRGARSPGHGRRAAAVRRRASARKDPTRVTRSVIARRLVPTLRAAAGRARGRRRSRAASASPSGGPRCSAGRRSCTTSASRSRSGAIFDPDPPDDLLALRRRAVRGRRQHQPPLRRGAAGSPTSCPSRRCG